MQGAVELKMPPKFQNTPLEDAVAVGAVGPHSARIWMRSRKPGRHRVQWWLEGSEKSDRRERIVTILSDDKSDQTHRFAIRG